VNVSAGCAVPETSYSYPFLGEAHAANIAGSFSRPGIRTRFGSTSCCIPCRLARRTLACRSRSRRPPLSRRLARPVAVIRPRAQNSANTARRRLQTVVCRNAAEAWREPRRGRAAQRMPRLGGRARRHALPPPGHDRVIAKALSEGAAIAAPAYRGERGHPVALHGVPGRAYGPAPRTRALAS